MLSPGPQKQNLNNLTGRDVCTFGLPPTAHWGSFTEPCPPTPQPRASSKLVNLTFTLTKDLVTHFLSAATSSVYFIQSNHAQKEYYPPNLSKVYSTSVRHKTSLVDHFSPLTGSVHLGMGEAGQSSPPPSLIEIYLAMLTHTGQKQCPRGWLTSGILFSLRNSSSAQNDSIFSFCSREWRHNLPPLPQSALLWSHFDSSARIMARHWPKAVTCFV